MRAFWESAPYARAKLYHEGASEKLKQLEDHPDEQYAAYLYAKNRCSAALVALQRMQRLKDQTGKALLQPRVIGMPVYSSGFHVIEWGDLRNTLGLAVEQRLEETLGYIPRANLDWALVRLNDDVELENSFEVEDRSDIRRLRDVALPIGEESFVFPELLKDSDVDLAGTRVIMKGGKSGVRYGRINSVLTRMR